MRPVAPGTVLGRLLPAALVGALLAAAAAGASTTERETSARRGADYIVAHQEPNGAFFSTDQTVDTTGETLVAAVAGGGSEEAVDRALGYIGEHGPGRATEKAGYAGRVAMGIAAAGRDPRNLEGVDYVALIEDHYDPATGRYHDDNGTLYGNALALLGLAAGRVTPPDQAIRYVRGNQCGDGGFGWAPGCSFGAEVDTTSHVVAALLAAGVPRDDLAISRARDWLVDARNEEGGFGQKPGDPTNANSTGLALSAIAALAEDPTDDPWGDPEHNPVEALLGLQTDSGGFKWRSSQSDPQAYATRQAVPGMAGEQYPLLPEADTEATPTREPSTSTARPTATPGAERTSEPTPHPQTETSAHYDSSVEGPRDDGEARPVETTPVQEGPSDAGIGPETDGDAPGGAFGSGEHRAGLLVRGEDGELRRMCVLFDDPETNGLALLERAGLDLGTERFQGQGTAICRIGPDGCSSDDGCFCEYPTFWGYWVRDPGDEDWRLSELGAERRAVVDGSMDAWAWGPNGGEPPPDLGVSDVCPTAADEGTTSTATPRPTPETTEEGPVNVPAMAGVGTLLLGSGVALGVRRWRAG